MAFPVLTCGAPAVNSDAGTEETTAMFVCPQDQYDRTIDAEKTSSVLNEALRFHEPSDPVDVATGADVV